MTSLSHSMKRRIIQLIAFVMTNAQILNLGTGKLYKGPWKQFCSPGLNCYSCPAAVAACPIGAMQAVAGSGSLGFSFYAAGSLMLIGVILGRAVCGFLCPFGLLQELFYKIPSPKHTLFWKKLIYVKYLMLLLFVILLPIVWTDYVGMGRPAFCEYICPAGTLEGGIPLLLARPELREAAGALFLWKMGILSMTIAGCILTERFFCKVLCPLGAIYGLLNRFSVYHLQVDRNKCTSCGTCVKTCPMEINPAIHTDSGECIRCGECTAKCPEQALHLVWSGMGYKEPCSGLEDKVIEKGQRS